MSEQPERLAKLLRAIAGGSDARQSRHDVIFNAAADELDRLVARIAELEAPSTELALDAPLASRTFSIAVALDAKFRDFQTAFLAAGGQRQPKSVDARGWDAARKNFIRLVTKQKHNPDAIVSGTWAYADSKPEAQYVPAPEVFLNKEWFTKTWAPNGGGPKPIGNQRGATSLFDVGFGQSR